MTASPDPFGWAGHDLNGKYHVERVVGEGGFGVVYRAMHRGLNEPVAIKCLKMPASLAGQDRAAFEQSFLDEGRLLHRLSRAHAGIAQAMDMGTAISPSGIWTPFLVLEWLEGNSLLDELEARRARGDATLPVREALDLIAPALDALTVAHEEGVAHRDLKPANLFLAQIGGRTMLKVLDFGIAKVLAQTVTLTRAFEETGASIKAFTPQYGAPEQFDPSRGATGTWTDVFALGLIFVELVTGRPALEGMDTIQLFVASANPQARPTPRRRGARVPDAVDRVVEKALAVNPRERYLNAGEFRDDLFSAVHGSLDTKRVLRTAASGTELAPGPLPEALQGSHREQPPSPSSSHQPRGTTTSPQVGPVPPAPRSDAAKGIPATVILSLGAVSALALGLGAAAWWAHGHYSADASGSSLHVAASGASAPQTTLPVEGASPPPTTEMVRVPAGAFTMGRKTASAAERPEHTVTLSRSFLLDRNEVTVAQYAACVQSGACTSAGLHGPDLAPSDVSARGALCNSFDPARANHPINCVDRLQAEAYCRFARKRLPTEAEWEYAARGPASHRFPWGNERPSCSVLVIERAGAGVCRDGTTGTGVVGSYPANASPFGALDMAGNVREWVSDGFDENAYRRGAVSDPHVPWKPGMKGIVRGGGWESPLGDASAWRRVPINPATGDLSTGIRCAREPE
jgi:formylglycine-generating enzyme required for sulfatase activity